MAVNVVDAHRDIAAPAEIVYRCIADYNERPRWLPPNFTDLVIEKDGIGAGTAVRYMLSVGRRQRTYAIAVTEPRPGAVLSERDTGSSLVTTWTVGARDGGASVAIHTEWQGAGGVGGFFERLFAPGALKRVYDDALARLDRYAVENSKR